MVSWWYFDSYRGWKSTHWLWFRGGAVFSAQLEFFKLWWFALSVVHSNSIIHYQIRRHPLSDQDEKAEEALFSLSVETRVIHGLDELIFYYQRQPKSGLQHKLGRFVPGNPCPTSVRLHGVENLLHRASMAGNTLIVQELLRCGGRDISAKNHDGLAG